MACCADLLTRWFRRGRGLTANLVVAAAVQHVFVSGIADAARRADGQLRIEIVDRATGTPIAARMHLKQARGRPVNLRIAGSAAFADHFYVDGNVMLALRAGRYTFALEASPEYLTQRGHFEIARHADDVKRIEMRQFANLAEEGWWAGDLDVSRRPADLPLVMRSEGLAIVPNEAWNDDDRQAIDDTIVARTPFSWDLPVWLAGGELDAIVLVHHHLLREGVVDSEEGGRPRDRVLYPGPKGNGRWSEAIYHHVLNCGLRIPPAAGSGSGTNQSPVGTNRVYVYCGEPFTEERWWDGLEAGRVFVTNGPLLRPRVAGQPPGYVFHLGEGESLELEIALDLATRTPIEYLQIVKNGEIDAEVRLDELGDDAGRLPPVVFDDSGWFLIRAVTDEQRTYQFASSGPYYVEKRGRPLVRRRSVQFFLEWIEEAIERLRGMDDLTTAVRERRLAEQESARAFFEQLLESASTD